MPRSRSRVLGVVGFTVFLAGCPFAMNDYTVEVEDPVEPPPAADAAPPPPMDPPDASPACDACDSSCECNADRCPMDKMMKDCKPDAACKGHGC